MPDDSQYKRNLDAWFEAARTGEIKFTVVHCKQYQGSVLPDGPGLTALHLAAQGGHTGTVKYLLPYEKDVRSDTGWTALMSAAMHGHDAAVAALAPYQAGRQLTAAACGYPAGATAVEIAASRGHLSTTKALLAFDQERPYLAEPFLAALDLNEQALRVHAAAGVQTRDCLGRTPLHYAALSPRDPTVSVTLLVDLYRGARDASGKTPLMLAAEFGRADAVRVLIERTPEDVGAAIPDNPSCGDHEGSTALILAADAGHLACVKHLLDAENAQPNKTGTTAMMFAARRGFLEIVGTLAPFEATLQSTAPLGHAPGKATALQHAALAGHAPVVGLLAPLEHGLRNDAGQSSYDIAAQHGHRECQEVLQVYEDEVEPCTVTALILDSRSEEFNLVTDKPLTEAIQRLADLLGVRDSDGFFQAIEDVLAQGDAIRELEKLRVELQVVAQERDDLRAKVDEQTASIREMKGHLYDMSELEKKIAAAEERYAEKVRDVQAMEEEVEEVKAAARQEVEAARGEVELMNAHVRELEKHITDLQNSDDSVLGQLITAQERVKELEGELARAEAAGGDAARELGETRRELDALSAEHEDAKKLLEEMEEMQRNLLGMQEAMEQFEAEGITVERYADLRAEVETLRERLFDRSRKVTEANSVISMLIDDMWICNKRLSDTLKKATESSRALEDGDAGPRGSQHFAMPDLIDEMSNLIRSGSLGRSAVGGDLGLGELDREGHAGPGRFSYL